MGSLPRKPEKTSNPYRTLRYILALNPKARFQVSINKRTIAVISFQPYIVLRFPLLDMAKVLSMLPNAHITIYNEVVMNSVFARINTMGITWNVIQFAGRVCRISAITNKYISLVTVPRGE